MSAAPTSLASIPPPYGRGAAARAMPARVAQLGGGLPAPLLMVGAMLSFQLGAAVATGLFAQVGVPATAFLKNAVGGLLLVAIARPNLRRPPAELAWLLAFGIELAIMNVAFYAAIQRIPLGVAVTVEFLGPLSVALLHSRRLRDVLWVILAAAGITIFAGVPTSGGIDVAGLLFAVLAGAGWACYIFTAQRVGRAWEGSQGLAAGMLASAVLLAPLGARPGRIGLGGQRAGGRGARGALGGAAVLARDGGATPAHRPRVRGTREPGTGDRDGGRRARPRPAPPCHGRVRDAARRDGVGRRDRRGVGIARRP